MAWDQEMIDSHKRRHESLRAMFAEVMDQMLDHQQNGRYEKVREKQALLLDTFNKSDEGVCNLFLKLMEAEPRYYLVYFYDDGGAVDHHGEMTPEEAIRTAQGRRMRFFQEINKWDVANRDDPAARGVRVES